MAVLCVRDAQGNGYTMDQECEETRMRHLYYCDHQAIVRNLRIFLFTEKRGNNDRRFYNNCTRLLHYSQRLRSDVFKCLSHL